MKQKGPPWGYIVPVVIVVGVIVGAVYFSTRSGVDAASTTLPAGNNDFPFPFLSGTTSLYLHIHPWLRIFIDGKLITIPGAIGIMNPGIIGNANGGYVYGSNAQGTTEYQPVHTHDNSGVIHIEADTDQNFTLADFFQIWAATYAYALVNGTHEPIVFNSTDILGYKTNAKSTLTLLVDGVRSSAYETLVLNTLDYCGTSNPGTTCYTASGDPLWDGGQATYPYGENHTIIIEYNSTAT
jgi:hypothetical protein